MKFIALKPKPDITAYELALILSELHVSLREGAADRLGEHTMRHFVYPILVEVSQEESKSKLFSLIYHIASTYRWIVGQLCKKQKLAAHHAASLEESRNAKATKRQENLEVTNDKLTHGGQTNEH